MRLTEAAKRIECSTSKLSRLERGEGIFKEIEVQALLDLYRVKDEKDRQRILRWTRDSKATVWWQRFSNVVAEDLELFIALEAEAREIRYFSYTFLPGLLQTPAYATEMISQYATDNPVLVKKLVDLRLARRHILDDRNADERVQLKIVLAEELLHRELSHPSIMRGELELLLNRANDPNIELQVLRTATPRRIANATFTHFIPSDPDDWEVVNEEGNFLDHWYETDDAIERFRDIWNDLMRISIGGAHAQDIIRDVLRQKREE